MIADGPSNGRVGGGGFRDLIVGVVMNKPYMKWEKRTSIRSRFNGYKTILIFCKNKRLTHV